MTPEAVEHTVSLPEPEPEATEAIERGALPSLGFVSKPGDGRGKQGCAFGYSSFWMSR